METILKQGHANKFYMFYIETRNVFGYCIAVLQLIKMYKRVFFNFCNSSIKLDVSKGALLTILFALLWFNYHKKHLYSITVDSIKCRLKVETKFYHLPFSHRQFCECFSGICWPWSKLARLTIFIGFYPKIGEKYYL